MLTELSKGIWMQVEPLSMMGSQFGNRTTVILLENKKLVLHSPGKLTPELKQNLDCIGEVAYIVAPNYFHSLFLEDYVSEYSNIQIFMAPNLDKKRNDIPCKGILGNQENTEWKSVLKQRLIEGMPSFNEVVFFHEPSRSLILTDLAVNMLHPKGIMTNIHFFVSGANRRFAFSHVVRMMIKDQDAFSDSIKYILNWDFDRILMSHGEVVPSGGKLLMKEVFKKYLDHKTRTIQAS